MFAFQEIQLRDWERAWIELLASDPVDDAALRAAKVRFQRIHGVVSDPSNLDRKYFRDGKVTPLGLWHASPTHPKLALIARVIGWAQNELVSNPGTKYLSKAQLAAGSECKPGEAESALQSIEMLAVFASACVKTNDGTLDGFTFPTPRYMDGVLSFKTIEDTLERQFLQESRVDGAFSQVMTLQSIPQFATTSLVSRGTRQDSAFIMMPINPEEPALEDIANCFKDTCREFGIEARRANDIEHQDKITDVVLQQIRDAELLLADLSNERPNVYYEIGYAHALGKRPLLYRKAGTRLHFDLSVHNVPEYRNATELKTLLRVRLEHVLGRKPRK